MILRDLIIRQKRMNANGTNRNGARSVGRPKANIDWKEVGKMLEAGSTAEAIAQAIGVDRTRLYRRCETDNNVSFATFSQEKKAKGLENLRAKQYEVAMSGDKVMLIWLGKQRLGQSEKTETITDPEIVRLKQLIENRAKEKGVDFSEELRNYVEHYAPAPIRDKLASELVN